jgi:hypothetical protein
MRKEPEIKKPAGETQRAVKYLTTLKPGFVVSQNKTGSIQLQSKELF